MTPKHDIQTLIAELTHAQSFALVHRQRSTTVDLLLGPVTEARRLDQIPLEADEVLAMVPFRQVQERGFPALEDDLPILCLEAQDKSSLPLSSLVSELPADIPDLQDLGFDLSDTQYAEVAERVIEKEIGGGEGANFVIRRDYSAALEGGNANLAALSWFRRLLERERGAYWTFIFVTPELIAVGASPERHVSVTDGVVRMNPISGTLRHGDTAPSVQDLLEFLADRKESEELVMVVDEELKMMSEVCPDGGVMRGPYLKPMSRLTHTEYLLEGHSKLDPREILRLTMFAPTVTGSPMGNACAVIARNEQSPRGYYSGVLARFTKGDGRYDLDAPILIRTAFLDRSGSVRVSAGATLVRHSDAASEAAETRAKVSGVLNALGLVPPLSKGSSDSEANPAVSAAAVQEALHLRNRHLAPFWRDEQEGFRASSGTALVVDCGDDFTAMLAHQLRQLGLSAEVLAWNEITDIVSPDLVVFGPGPGDPRSHNDPRIIRLRELIGERLGEQKALLTVCLSHQILCDLAGLSLEKLPEPRQGTTLEVSVLGELAQIGYYNTFTAIGKDGSLTPALELRVDAELLTDYVHALSGPRVASVQGHLESVLSYDGFATLGRLVQTVMKS